jgi:hypothetical protein
MPRNDSRLAVQQIGPAWRETDVHADQPDSRGARYSTSRLGLWTAARLARGCAQRGPKCQWHPHVARPAHDRDRLAVSSRRKPVTIMERRGWRRGRPTDRKAGAEFLGPRASNDDALSRSGNATRMIGGQPLSAVAGCLRLIGGSGGI